MTNPHAELWAKASELGETYPLAGHLLDTAAMAHTLFAHWLRPGLRQLVCDALGERVQDIVAVVAGLHDIGKANPVFQGQLAIDPPPPWIGPIRDALREHGYGMDLPNIAQRGGVTQPTLRRHEQVTAMQLAVDTLEDGDKAEDNWQALIGLGHHGKFVGIEHPELYEDYACGQWQRAREDIIQLVHEAYALRPEDMPERVPAAVTILVSGLTILADRLASHQVSVDRSRGWLAEGILSFERPTAWRETQYDDFIALISETVGLYQDFSDAQGDILDGHPPRELQEIAMQTGEGLWVVEAPTGTGKTEAALLRHAQARENLMFLLPTQATTSAMMKRIQHVYRETTNVAALAHGFAAIEDFYAQPMVDTPPEIADRDGHECDSSPRGLLPSHFVQQGSGRLLAPVVVATVDQALMGALPLKWTSLRLLALANAHIVVDEAHTLEYYQTALLEPLLEWWGATSTRVSLLTATLPSWQRDTFMRAYRKYQPKQPLANDVGSPSAPSGDELSFPCVQRVHPKGMDGRLLTPQPYVIDVTCSQGESPVQLHVDWYEQMRAKAPRARLGIVVNQIARAQEIGQHLVAMGEEVIVLHSRMTAGHRQAIVRQLEERIGKTGSGEGLVVIGTQAIEASLDIDLDAMSTDLAPAPSLLQRAGRVWRRADGARGERLPGYPNLPMHIVRSDAPYAHLPYFERALHAVWTFLQAHPQLHLPEDSQAFIEESAFSLDAIEDADYAGIDFGEGAEQDGDTGWQERAFEAAIDEAAAVSMATQAAKDARIDLTWFLSKRKPEINRFRALSIAADTHGRDAQDYMTRLIERESARCIVQSMDGSVPGGWEGSWKDYGHISAGNIAAIRKVLQATITVSNRQFIRAALRSAPEDVGVPQSSLLAGCVPIDLVTSEDLYYDPVLGLMKKDAPDHGDEQ